MHSETTGNKIYSRDKSCELHSNLVSLHSETTRRKLIPFHCLLWITFKSCIFAFWNNRILPLSSLMTVVNYIQILYLCILKQLGGWGFRYRPCCELHSNLVSLHSETTHNSPFVSCWVLWITFKSCIFAFWNNFRCFLLKLVKVVNYIQILYLCILKQHRVKRWLCSDSCELHSNLVSLHSETTGNHYEGSHHGLWITFKSCIFAFWNNPLWLHPLIVLVVNYIQILYLCILKQHFIFSSTKVVCCELHSNLVSLHSETTKTINTKYVYKLWITFKSCIFAFWNNGHLRQILFPYVVNYIQILYLCILKQLLFAVIRSYGGCELHSNLVSLHSETTNSFV